MATTVPLKPDLSGRFPDATINIANPNEGVVYDVGGWDLFSLQVLDDSEVAVDRNSAAHALKVQKSNAGMGPVDFATPVTQSVVGMTATQTVTCMGFVHATNTTVGTSGKIRLIARVDRNR